MGGAIAPPLFQGAAHLTEACIIQAFNVNGKNVAFHLNPGSTYCFAWKCKALLRVQLNALLNLSVVSQADKRITLE